MQLRRVLSDGQAGVGRAALDVAKVMGLSYGGWCSAGRRMEDGVVDVYHHLRPTASVAPSISALRNIRESDGTLIVDMGSRCETSQRVLTLTREARHPCLVLDLGQAQDADEVREWIKLQGIKVLFVQGVCESTVPGVYQRSRRFLTQLLQD